MSVILSLYSQAVYKEILLPAVNNADHSVILNKNTFSLQDDIVLKMEIVDHQWHFLKDDGYAIYKNNAPFYGQTIHDKDMLLLTDQYGRQLTILVRETQNSFTVYKKYSLNHISQLIIGNKKNTGTQRSTVPGVQDPCHLIFFRRPVVDPGRKPGRRAKQQRRFYQQYPYERAARPVFWRSDQYPRTSNDLFRQCTCCR